MRAGRALLVVIAIALASLIIVNAAVFSYRWLKANIPVQPATGASGAACTGFYSSIDQRGIDMPDAGTNYNAYTYGTNTITVTPGSPVCQWPSDSPTYNLYESISVRIPLTNGSWYIKDFYGFGYHGAATDPTVYVWLKVDTPITPPAGVEWAELRVYKAVTGELVATIDLKTNQNIYGPIQLSPGEALQLDLNFKSTASTETSYSFTVYFYVSQQSSEPPR
ncbi:hypothetical protein DKAM_0079 [Desulfurococcus amylolyticus 1221n]|uniref:Uncharacterized protein n=1 Tax=Desulfurococcus amylolyticus (strain DSM 18924 / JCM 16383 / VKM B-2413 / 1221n) TaxID=490899 RepID=B8D3D9_DESA1|nr:hypothetical protein [Desulfurococcus amylolyticus]ACL10408.1 hypothetical protein DKAM_0079 [Desulfurococcus amylolyticus 1221n]